MSTAVLQVLRERVNHRGLVLVRTGVLQSSVGCSFQEVELELKSLREAGKIEILNPPPFLVVALKPRSWSSSRPVHVLHEQQRSSGNPVAHKSVPVSSSIAAAASKQEDGGAGEGARLLAEVLAVLGPEASAREFTRILAGRPHALILRCLRRVEATKRIRVSKPALFRSLLDRLAA